MSDPINDARRAITASHFTPVTASAPLPPKNPQPTPTWLPLPGPGDVVIEGIGVRPAEPPSFARIPLRKPGPPRDISLYSQRDED